MGFFKDRFGVVLIPLVYIIIILQAVGVYISWDKDNNSYLFYTKILFVINFVLSIWCHLKATFTCPGAITHENNVHVLELYINTHRHCVKNAENFNRKFRSVLEEQMKDRPEEGKESDSDHENSDFGYQYDIHSSIRDSAIEEISKEYKIKFTRCRKCLVVRVPRAHHCTKCKQCFMKKDHHCPWINNCLGQFNQKHFMLFCYYSMNGIFFSMYTMLYYVIYKENIVDFQKKVFMEARDIDECWEEAFGEPFHILWFLPINRNRIRDTYLKGRLPEDEKAEETKEEIKEEKKETVEDKKNLVIEKNEKKKEKDKNELKKDK